MLVLLRSFGELAVLDGVGEFALGFLRGEDRSGDEWMNGDRTFRSELGGGVVHRVAGILGVPSKRSSNPSEHEGKRGDDCT